MAHRRQEKRKGKVVDNGYKLIEELLTSLKIARKGIENEIQNLVNSGLEEEDVDNINKAASALYRHHNLLEEFIVATLSDNWNSKETRDSILQQKLFLVMKRTAQNEERNVMEYFLQSLEKKLK